MPSHVVLIGLSGSGKSSVGALAAERLGAPFVDVDQLIVRREGMPITAIFGARGEAGFRAVEATVVRELLAGAPSVIAPGAGWAAQPGQLDEAFPVALVVYLETSPAIAVRRLGGQTESRPLLSAGEPLEQMRKLLDEREGYYAIAHHRLNTDRRTEEQLADEIARLASAGAGW
jgi:shikimate kinase